MVTATEAPGYAHTQKAPLCLIFYGAAVLCFAVAWAVGLAPGSYIAGATGLILALVAPLFHYLKVEDRGDRLAIRFGPLSLFHRTVRYADIARVEVGRTRILEGWGIHYSVRGGWVWNLWGRGCVVIHRKDGSVLRLGTDDAMKLVEFLRSKVRE